MRQLNQRWVDETNAKLANTGDYEITTALNMAIQSLVIRATQIGRPFKIHNLGAGVKMFTTKTDTCPCCKRKL